MEHADDDCWIDCAIHKGLRKNTVDTLGLSRFIFVADPADKKKKGLLWRNRSFTGAGNFMNAKKQPDEHYRFNNLDDPDLKLIPDAFGIQIILKNVLKTIFQMFIDICNAADIKILLFDKNCHIRILTKKEPFLLKSQIYLHYLPGLSLMILKKIPQHRPKYNI